jgi:hypothetical protein
MDELFDKKFGSSQALFPHSARKYLKSHLTVVEPLVSLRIPTYSESKSTLTNLSSSVDKDILARKFFKTFSYLWIKTSPTYKGAGYRKSVSSGYHLTIPISAAEISSEGEGESGSDSDTLSLGIGEQRPSISINRALYHQGSRKAVGNGNGSFSYENSPSSGLTPVSLSSVWTSNVPNNTTNFPRVPGMDILSSTLDLNGVTAKKGFGRDPDISSNIGLDLDHFYSEWLQKCTGEALPSQEVKENVKKMCAKIWKMVIGVNNGEPDSVECLQ